MTEKERKLKGEIYYCLIKPVLKNIRDIPCAVIKGEPLSILAYGRCGCRDFSDIDLLVAREELPQMEYALRQAGFAPVDSSKYKRIFYDLFSHQTIPYFRMAGNVPIYVDINYDIFWGEYKGKRIDINEFLSDCVWEEIYGTRVPVLTPQKAFVQLILHAYKELNSLYLLDVNHGYSHRVFEDVYALVKNNRDTLSPENILTICTRCSVCAYAFYILYYTYQAYREEWLLGYVEVMACDEGKQLLPCFGLNETERREWDVDFADRFHIDDFYGMVAERYSEEDARKIKINRDIQNYEY